MQTAILLKQLRSLRSIAFRRSGFTLTELLIVSAMISILGVLLVPALSTANETSKAAVCLGNMHQWGLAISMYCEDYNDYFPPEGNYSPAGGSPWGWYTALPRYINTPALFTLYAQGKPPTPKTQGDCI